tara:strand:- start:1129 stop:1653 length:525 start_codon:yes stop_codon:yes gene_type:complete
LIKLDCDNYLVKQTLTDYLEKKNFSLVSENEIYFTKIKVCETEKNICLTIDDLKKEISLPVDLNLLSSEILKTIADVSLSISNYQYFPFQRLVKNSKKKSLLSDIQNIILNTILLCKEGIDKDHLYKKIWKRDKSIQINKLDTHLTNLKNKLKDDLDLNVNFHSHEKKLRLLID